MSEQSEKPMVHPDSTTEESLTIEVPERRGVVRYPFIAVAEVIELRTQTPVSGRCSDLSEGGCYVDTLAPFAADSLLRIVIRHDSREFRAKAVAAYSHPSMGMGIRFTEIEPEFRNVLQYWLANLRGEPMAEPAQIKPPSEPVSSADVDSNTRVVLIELVTILVRKKIITEMEAAELMFRVFR